MCRHRNKSISRSASSQNRENSGGCGMMPNSPGLDMEERAEEQKAVVVVAACYFDVCNTPTRPDSFYAELTRSYTAPTLSNSLKSSPSCGPGGGKRAKS